jgi:hypothetical protein
MKRRARAATTRVDGGDSQAATNLGAVEADERTSGVGSLGKSKRDAGSDRAVCGVTLRGPN